MYECAADGFSGFMFPAFPDPELAASLEVATENVLLSPVMAVSIDFGNEITPIRVVLSRYEAVRV